MECDLDAEYCVKKLKDSLWVNEKESLERIRLYVKISKGELSGLRLIIPLGDNWPG